MGAFNFQAAGFFFFLGLLAIDFVFDLGAHGPTHPSTVEAGMSYYLAHERAEKEGPLMLQLMISGPIAVVFLSLVARVVTQRRFLDILTLFVGMGPLYYFGLVVIPARGRLHAAGMDAAMEVKVSELALIRQAHFAIFGFVTLMILIQLYAERLANAPASKKPKHA
eukprot:TRINITY_DN5389_c0_g1::TRINITY_DN5389_c0_g1_i1::g.24189::m.24189 TRINITY_DN5389_c0_g1::TRINITY_DN5389_c0_g1_i1::g.24189  ORF type:complete len:173 (-),score=35.53,DUF1772/PF08592.6/54,DUF1772/PF08592.6/0.73 TRINITY_DN5389_c0_g1_i1:69-566(-)